MSFKLIEITKNNYQNYNFDINDDPVRKELDLHFRLDFNRKIYALIDDITHNYISAICFAFTNLIPTTIKELDNNSQNKEKENIVVFYTVWSKFPGAGQQIIFAILNYIKQNFTKTNRYITLSPKTNMAHRFHIKNGAKLIQENNETNNYEYF